MLFYSDSSCAVKAVMSGFISSIFEINGNYSVLIKSENLFICYSNLFEPLLKKGDTIKAGDYLADIKKDEDRVCVEISILTKNAELDAFDYFKNTPPSKTKARSFEKKK